MDLPATLRRLSQHGPMEHRHVIMQPDCEAHKGLGQAQQLGRRPGLSREHEDEVHQQKQEVQHVPQRLQNLHAHVGGLRGGVEEPERLVTSGERA